MAKVIGIDYGLKRIGIAISDPDGTVAFPRETLTKKSTEEVIQYLKDLIQEEEVGKIIIGWPLSLEGKITAQTEKTEVFINALNESIDIPIEKMDERWTTAQADRTQGDDAVAAQIILQNHLDVV